MTSDAHPISLPVFLIAVLFLLPVYVVRRTWGQLRPASGRELVTVRVGSEEVYADPEWAVQSISGKQRARLAFVQSYGSRRMIHRRWVAVFCKFVDYWRNRRGDVVLPRAWRPQRQDTHDPPDSMLDDGGPASRAGTCNMRRGWRFGWPLLSGEL